MHFQENSSVNYIFSFLFNKTQLLKERVCSSWSKFFPLRVDSILDGHSCPGAQIGSHKSFSFVKKVAKTWRFIHTP